MRRPRSDRSAPPARVRPPWAPLALRKPGAPRQCRGHAKTDKYTSRNITFPLQVATPALHPQPGRAGDQCVETITRQTHQCKQQTEEGDLYRDRAARGIDELRQKRQEKQRRLRIQNIYDETVAIQLT